MFLIEDRVIRVATFLLCFLGLLAGEQPSSVRSRKTATSQTGCHEVTQQFYVLIMSAGSAVDSCWVTTYKNYNKWCFTWLELFHIGNFGNANVFPSFQTYCSVPHFLSNMILFYCIAPGTPQWTFPKQLLSNKWIIALISPSDEEFGNEFGDLEGDLEKYWSFTFKWTEKKQTTI